MVVPVLLRHETWHKHKAQYARDNYRGHAGQLLYLVEPLDELQHAQTNPNGKGIERTSVGVVALTWLQWGLVEVENNGKTRHEEEAHDNAEALLAVLSFPNLPQHTKQTQDEGQHIIFVVTLVVL